MLAQATATEKSLQNEGRPTYSLEIKKINEESLGELMAFWMDLIALMGAGLRVNPFDQPGVEKGKSILKEILK